MKSEISGTSGSTKKYGLADFLFVMSALTSAIVTGMLIGAGCATAEKATPSQDYTVVLYSGGIPVRTWNTKGWVWIFDHNGRAEFTDAQTGKEVRVIGTIVVEEKKPTTPDVSTVKVGEHTFEVTQPDENILLDRS